MSDPDQVKPYHAKDAAPGQEAADVVAEVLQHAAEREEAARKKAGPKAPPKWMLPLTVNLGVLALYFLIAQPEFIVVTAPEDPRTAVERSGQERGAVYYQAIQPIEAFRTANGRLPADLAEAGSPLGAAGLQYTVVSDSTYRLTFGDHVFDSAADEPRLWAPDIDFGG